MTRKRTQKRRGKDAGGTLIFGWPDGRASWWSYGHLSTHRLVLAAERVDSTPEALAPRVAREIDVWNDVVRRSGVKAN
jgi:hypothetical protein